MEGVLVEGSSKWKGEVVESSSKWKGGTRLRVVVSEREN